MGSNKIDGVFCCADIRVCSRALPVEAGLERADVVLGRIGGRDVAIVRNAARDVLSYVMPRHGGSVWRAAMRKATPAGRAVLLRETASGARITERWQVRY
jgi:hypothetical protein